ncbi:DUF2000 family protein [Streptomyces sp. Ru72]|uniref:DUF2000 family protein n=1 Tax=Streptomyces sp. Ru72 TaxID=2080747 RepID=UPI000CDDFD01|nr:DUF2000 family protein [Streptomyces sp. Ru72]POX48329.1 hypothetical protein C3488_21055 [Streptomyces sp. Ru72]
MACEQTAGGATAVTMRDAHREWEDFLQHGRLGAAPDDRAMRHGAGPVPGARRAGPGPELTELVAATPTEKLERAAIAVYGSRKAVNSLTGSLPLLRRALLRAFTAEGPRGNRS